MKTVTIIGAGFVAATIVTAASADVTITLTNKSFTGLSFMEAINYAAGANLVGTLTGASINVTLDSSVSYTYADDLCLYIDQGEFSTEGLLQIGGYSDLEASERHIWPNGASDAPGTTAIGTVTLESALQFTGDRLVDGTIWIGNGYGADATLGTWTGTVTLHGVNTIPAPGAMALLGLIGLTRRTRR